MTSVESFLTWARDDRRRSPHTLARYRAVLASVEPFGDPLTIDRDALEAWWASRYQMSPGTRANELACLRSFYRWATKFDHRADDPTRRLDSPKVPNMVPRMIGRSDFDRLLGELTEDAPDLRRAYALGGYAGLRVSEAAALDWRNVEYRDAPRRIYIRGKGEKERPVPLSAVLLDYLLPDTGGNVVAAMRRTAPAGDFRANIHLGGTAVVVTLPPATQAIAIAAAQAVGLEVAGVDLLETAAGPLVIEVNSTPGLEEIEATTGVDVAGAIVGYLG